MRSNEAGFSLIEVLIAAALFAGVAFGGFELVRQLVFGGEHLTARRLGYAALDRFTARLRTEARSATAIWIGAPSASTGHDDCVELDFYTADAAGPRFWSYRSFPNHTRADIVPAGVIERVAALAPIAPCDATQRGDIALDGLQSPPALAALAPGLLSSHTDAYLGQNDSTFVGASVPATAPISLGVLDAAGVPVSGGNTLIEARVDTTDGSRVIDLLPGIFPSGFTEVLRYTCSERCDVGHDGSAPKTLTRCAMSWQTGWSRYVRWTDYTTNADGSLSFPGGWFIAGTFAFTYEGTRASDGGTDTLVKPYVATNDDPSRDYSAYPPDRPAPDGSLAGSFAPFDVRSEPAATWLGDLTPYLAAGESGPIAAEKQRCDAVQQQGASGGFYANG